MKPPNLADFKLHRAVEARQTLSRPYDDASLRISMERVYTPTDQALRRLAKQPPPILRCLHSQEYEQQEVPEGSFVHVDLVLPDKTVVYLGLVCNQAYARWHWREADKRYEKTLGDSTEVCRRGSLTILREWYVCIIPVESQRLSDRVIVDATHRYLIQIAPSLIGSRVDFNWLPRETMHALERQIMKLADKPKH